GDAHRGVVFDVEGAVVVRGGVVGERHRPGATAQHADGVRRLPGDGVARDADRSRDADQTDAGGPAAGDTVAGEREVPAVAGADAPAIDVVAGEGGVGRAEEQDGAFCVDDELVAVDEGVVEGEVAADAVPAAGARVVVVLDEVELDLRLDGAVVGQLHA